MRFFVDGSITTPITEYLTNPKYQQVEYLESTGTQYIDTGINASDSIGTNVKFNFTENTLTQTEFLMGSNVVSGGVNTSRFNPLYCTSSVINTMLNIPGTVGVKRNYDTNVHILEFNKYPNKSVVFDGVIDGTVQGIGNGISINLFRRNFSTGYAYSKARIYYCQLLDAGVLVRDFIPAIRKEDGKPGMYDKISGQFFTNAGTGEFLYGNPVYNGVPRGYKECEYLESTGTQWIDTGVIGTQNTSIELSITPTQINTKIFGCRTGTSSNNISVFYGSSADARLGIDFNNSNYATYRCQYGNILNQKIIIKADKNSRKILDINGSVLEENNTVCTDTILTPDMLKLFDITNGFQSDLFIGTCDYCKIWDSNTLVRDYIPALREADNEPGMYDRVSNTFFTNKGTGTFTYKLKERQTEKVTRILYSGSKMRLVRNTAA